MAIGAVAAGISAISGLVGTGVSIYGTLMQAKAAKKAEKLREIQMNLEAARNRREQVRRVQAAQAKAAAAAWQQGAGTSSALAGGLAQIANEGGRNIVAINQDQTLGKAIFAANRDATQGQMLSSLGSGISSLGGAVANVAGTITKIGDAYPGMFGSNKKEYNAA